MEKKTQYCHDVSSSDWTYGSVHLGHDHCQLFCCCRSAAESCPTLRPHGLQHARLPCSSPTPRACSNSCPLSPWCHPTISSSVTLFSSSPWTARRSKQSILKEINCEYSLEGLMLKLKFQYLDHLMQRANSLEKLYCGYWQTDCKVYMERQKTQAAHTVLKESKVGGLTVSTYKTYCRAAVTETGGGRGGALEKYWQRGQCNKTKNYKIDPQ